MENEIIEQLTAVKNQFSKVIDNLKEHPEAVNTPILDLIDEINALSVVI